MENATLYKDDNLCDPGAVSPGTAWAASLAGNDLSGPRSPCVSATAWDSLVKAGVSNPLGRPEWPEHKPVPDYSLIVLALSERLRAVSDGMRHKQLFDARDACYQVEFLAKLLRLSVAHQLSQMLNPPVRPGVFVVDGEVG